MTQSFLDVARELIEVPEAKAVYADDPDGYLAARGLEAFTPAELEAAVGFVADALPAPVARQLAPAADGTPPPTTLAQLAATTAVEEAVREAEPGTVGLVAVLDPGGELGVPDPVEFGTLAAAARAEAAPGDEAEAAQAGQQEEQEEQAVEVTLTDDTTVADDTTVGDDTEADDLEDDPGAGLEPADPVAPDLLELDSDAALDPTLEVAALPEEAPDLRPGDLDAPD